MNAFLYAIEWVDVAFGINCVSNTGRKLVTASLPALQEQLISVNHTITN